VLFGPLKLILISTSLEGKDLDYIFRSMLFVSFFVIEDVKKRRFIDFLIESSFISYCHIWNKEMTETKTTL
jgi:hypothetical protein